MTSSRAVSSVIAGQLLDDQDEMTFLKNIGSAMDISVSVMGQGNVAIGTANHFAAGLALNVCRKAPPVEQEDHLPPVIQGGANGRVELAGDRASRPPSAGLDTQIDGSDPGHGAIEHPPWHLD